MTAPKIEATITILSEFAARALGRDDQGDGANRSPPRLLKVNC